MDNPSVIQLVRNSKSIPENTAKDTVSLASCGLVSIGIAFCGYISTSKDRHETPIVVDSGASFPVSPFPEDLIPGTIKEMSSDIQNLMSNP